MLCLILSHNNVVMCERAILSVKDRYPGFAIGVLFQSDCSFHRAGYQSLIDRYPEILWSLISEPQEVTSWLGKSEIFCLLKDEYELDGGVDFTNLQKVLSAEPAISFVSLLESMCGAIFPVVSVVGNTNDRSRAEDKLITIHSGRGPLMPSIAWNSASVWRTSDFISVIRESSTASEVDARGGYLLESLLVKKPLFAAMSGAQKTSANLSASSAARHNIDKSKISIIVPCYNQGNFLTDAIDSVLSQTFQNLECLIVNDGSTDGTEEIGKHFARLDRRIRLLNKKNGGLADARNFGIAASRGEYILPLDADDILLPEACRTLHQALEEHRSAHIAYPDYHSFGEQNGRVSCISEEEFYNPYRSDNGLPYFSLYRREVWEKIGGYRTNMTWGYEDWDFWLAALAAKFSAIHVAVPLVRYRTKKESMLTGARKYHSELTAQMVMNNKGLFDQATLARANQNGGTKPRSRQRPQVSIIIPTYNRPHLLQRSIRSVLSQDERDVEIIVVNDAGFEPDHSILHQDGRIRYVNHSENRGLAASRNTGIALAEGQYIGYLDDDDILLPNHLSLLLSACRRFEAKVVYANASRRWENEKGEVVRRDIPYIEPYRQEELIFRNITPVQTILHCRSCIDDGTRFDESLKRLEDWDFWSRLSETTSFLKINPITSEFSWRNDGSSMTSSSKIPFLLAELRILMRHSHRVEQRKHLLTRFEETIRKCVEALVCEIHMRSRGDEQPILELGEILADAITTFPQYERYFNFILENTLASHNFKERGEPQDFGKGGPTIRVDGDPERGRMERRDDERIKVSIVIPLFNSIHFTRNIIPALLSDKSLTKKEIILVDNGSSDGTNELLVGFGSQIKKITNSVNKNFSGACNQGAGIALGEYILFLNNDVDLLPGWLDNMVAVLDNHLDVGVVGNLQLFPNSNKVHHCGMYFNEHGLPIHYLEGVDQNDPRVLIYREMQCVTGACLLMRAGLFQVLGGFDEKFRNGYEDVDLCLRARAINWKIAYTPNSKIIHHVSRSPGRSTHSIPNENLFLSRWAGRVSPDLHEFQRQEELDIQEDLLVRSSDKQVIFVLHPRADLLEASYLRLLVANIRREVAGRLTRSQMPRILAPVNCRTDDCEIWVDFYDGSEASWTECLTSLASIGSCQVFIHTPSPEHYTPGLEYFLKRLPKTGISVTPMRQSPISEQDINYIEDEGDTCPIFYPSGIDIFRPEDVPDRERASSILGLSPESIFSILVLSKDDSVESFTKTIELESVKNQPALLIYSGRDPQSPRLVSYFKDIAQRAGYKGEVIFVAPNIRYMSLLSLFVSANEVIWTGRESNLLSQIICSIREPAGDFERSVLMEDLVSEVTSRILAHEEVSNTQKYSVQALDRRWIIF